MITCPTNTDMPGENYCAFNNEYECPIKYLRIYNVATLPEEVIDNPYTYEFFYEEEYDTLYKNKPLLIKSRSIGESPI